MIDVLINVLQKRSAIKLGRIIRGIDICSFEYLKLSGGFVKENQKRDPKTAHLKKESRSRKKRMLVHFYSFACKLLIS